MSFPARVTSNPHTQGRESSLLRAPSSYKSFPHERDRGARATECYGIQPPCPGRLPSAVLNELSRIFFVRGRKQGGATSDWCQISRFGLVWFGPLFVLAGDLCDVGVFLGTNADAVRFSRSSLLGSVRGACAM